MQEEIQQLKLEIEKLKAELEELKKKFENHRHDGHGYTIE